MSLNIVNSSLQNTSWPVTTTGLYKSSAVSYNNFSVSLLDEAEANLTEATTKFSNLTEEDGFRNSSESSLQTIKNITNSIFNTISSTVRSIVADTIEDGAIAFSSTIETQKPFSEELSTEKGSSTDQISTVQTEDDSAITQETTSAFRSPSNEDVTSATTDQTEEESTTIQSTTAFQSSSIEDVNREEGTIETKIQNITERVTIVSPTKSPITTPVIAILMGTASMLVAVVGCVYYKINKPRAVTVLPHQDVEMSLRKKN